MSTGGEDIVEAALDWAENGVPVFPCSRDKKPLTKNGFKDAVTDPIKVRELFSFYGPEAALIGGRMGKDAGMFAIDADLYKGAEVEAWLRDLEDRGLLTQTRIHKTMNGGLHFLYLADEYPNVYPIDGVEVRGEGAYIILTGSPGYEVIQSGITKASNGLIAELRKKQKSHAADTVDDLKMKIIQADNFHDSLARLAARYSAMSYTPERVMSLLREVLQASVAAHPDHPRHGRWKFIMEDQGKEFSRMVTTSHKKYNAQFAGQDMGDAASAFDLERMKAIASGFGMTMPNRPPTGGETTKRIKEPDEYEDWPFLDEGYFAHENHDLLSQRFVMHPLLAEEESILIAAQPKTGKTAIALTLGLHIACGLDMGASLKVAEPRPVLYLGLEGRRAIRLRIQAWREHKSSQGVTLPERIPLFVVEKSKNLLPEENRLELVNQIRAADNQLSKDKLGTLGAIFIDTYTKAMAGGDQNSVDDTSAVFDVVGRLRDAGIGASVVFIHHLSRQGNVRGSTNIEADPDMLCRIEKEGHQVTLTIDRARSIEEGSAYGFVLNNHHLGTSTQGFAINAPVVEPIDLATTPASSGISDATKESRILSLLIGMGKGQHNLKVFNDILHSAGLAILSKTKKRGPVQPMRVASEAVQEFYANLIPLTGRVFAGHGIERVVVDGNTVAIIIR